MISKAAEGLARLDKLIADYEANPTLQRRAKFARALRDAERRIAEGIGVRLIHVVVGEAVMGFKISDELAVLGRQAHRNHGDPEERCAMGLIWLREIVRAGGLKEALIASGSTPADQENTDLQMTVLGLAKLALTKLYDDLVLRSYHHSADEPIFETAEPLPLNAAGPSDNYFLVLDEDGEVPEFAIAVEPPPFLSDGQHRIRFLH